MSAPIFRRELFDCTPGNPDQSQGHPGRHVIQQRPGEPLEFFYITREGAMKQPPRLSARVSRWYAASVLANPQETTDA